MLIRAEASKGLADPPTPLQSADIAHLP